ncbi:hypothetical protein THAOC_25603, partial [Thalassiosira oceanica]
CWIARISAEQWGAVMEDEVAIRVHGDCPLPMGIGKEDRSAGGLRRPPESRAFPTSKLTIYLDDASSFEPSQRSFDIDYSMMRGRIGDPKASTPISGNRKQPRADAPFGRADDDNGPGSEPPPQDRIGLFMAVMPSPRRPPAAVGKPSFPYFKADYLPDDVCRPRRPTIFRHRISATRWRTKDPKAWAQTAGIR